MPETMQRGEEMRQLHSLIRITKASTAGWQRRARKTGRLNTLQKYFLQPIHQSCTFVTSEQLSVLGVFWGVVLCVLLG